MKPTRRALRQKIIEIARQCCVESGALFDVEKIAVKRAHTIKDWRERGEFSSNAPLVLSKILQISPAKCAASLRAQLLHWPGIIVEAKGFLNFRMDQTATKEIVVRAVREGARFGAGDALKGRRVNVEFVSSEPNSPLTLTSARHAVCGEALCRILQFQGADVTREFFVNDVPTSSKMRLLGESVGAFYEAQFGHDNLPEGILQDDFVRGVARDLAARDGNKHLLTPASERNLFFAREAAQAAISMQKQALQNLGVRFDLWTSENVLRSEGRVENALEKLRGAGYIYENDGAAWLQTSQFGDEFDHPVVRSDGQPTYLASDIAYHVWKFNRGFDLLLNIWSGEHRPYVARTQAALKAIGCDVGQLEILVCENARLRVDGEILEGRNGAPLLWQDALAEVSADNLRLPLLLADWHETATINAENATRDDEQNPAYAARLAPSRLATMIRQNEANTSQKAVEKLEYSPAEAELARLVALWPDTTENAALQRAPQQIARWTSEFAEAVRALLASSKPDTPVNLELLRGAQSAIQSALYLLGIEAKEQF